MSNMRKSVRISQDSIAASIRIVEHRFASVSFDYIERRELFMVLRFFIIHSTLFLNKIPSATVLFGLS